MADLAAIAVQKATLLEKERQVAVLEERERLSREMHDSLAQVLGYLHLKRKTRSVP
jgi:two-component system nitrate/nitrite sensor histidine kinase NarX